MGLKRGKIDREWSLLGPASLLYGTTIPLRYSKFCYWLCNGVINLEESKSRNETKMKDGIKKKIRITLKEN